MPAHPTVTSTDKPIILFDGVCNLCNGMIGFILRQDVRGVFRFAPLQSASGRTYLEKFGLDTGSFPSVVLIEGDRFFQASTAALRVMLRMGWPFKALYALMLLPRPIRDWVYGLIARNRYRLFGRTQECMLPTPEIMSRFLP